jgi:hypothetical protein
MCAVTGYLLHQRYRSDTFPGGLCAMKETRE